MKRIAALIMAMILLTGFAYKDPKPQKYTTLGSYIYNLMETSEIQINYFIAPKISDYFGDIKEKDYYAGAFIDAATAGIIKAPQKKIHPNNWIKISEAKRLMDSAYIYKTNQKINISKVVFSELIKMSKYNKVKDNQYLTSQMEKDLFSIYSKKIGEYKKGKDTAVKPEEKVSITQRKENNFLFITLDLGEKPSAGYGINIAGASEIGDTIEVYYTTSAPLAGEITAQVITYPKDTIILNVSNINKSYKIVAKKIDNNKTETVKYFTQINKNEIKLTLSLGEKPTGGYSVKILEAIQNGENIMVKYNIKTPAEGDLVTQAINYPNDSIDVKVKDINKRYGISLEAVSISSNTNNGIKTSTKRVGEYIEVTLDWGEKPTGGYSIKITEAKQVGNTIEVKYVTKSPKPEDIVLQVLTYPKDSVMVKVDDINKDYKVVLKN